MYCKKISLCNFRNIENECVEFLPGVNIISGLNAQGKTNLLEAIYYISLGKSFRTSHESEILRFGEEFASVSLNFESEGREQNITMRFSDKKRKQIEHNGIKINKLSELVGIFRAVLFCPDHLELIKGGPALRRNYLDVAISQIRPIYLHSLQKYYKILKQRNQLIKDYETDKETFNSTVDFWSAQLAHEAAVISKFRYEYIRDAEAVICDFYARLCSAGEIDEKPEFLYVGSAKQENKDYLNVEKTEKEYYKLLTTRLDREIGAGSTLYGIHKDDIEINLNGKNTRLFSSQGQQRSLSLAMKLSEGEICKKETGESPVYLFDDVFSELDETRRKFLLSEIKDKQVILTSCEDDFDFGVSVRKIGARHGKYFAED